MMKHGLKILFVLALVLGSGMWYAMLVYHFAMRNGDVDRLPMSPGEPAVVMEDWHVVVGSREYVIPAGFRSDGASIPQWLWFVCGTPMQAPRLYAAIWHDAAYSGMFAGMTRFLADLGYMAMLIHFWLVTSVTEGLDKAGRGFYARVRNGMVHVLNVISVVCAEAEFVALRLCGGSHWHTTTNTKG